MKKIFSFLLCAILFCALLVQPTSAVGLDSYPPSPQIIYRYNYTGYIIADWNYWGDNQVHLFLFSSSLGDQYRRVYLHSGSSTNYLYFDFAFDEDGVRTPESELHHYILDSSKNTWVFSDHYSSANNNGTYYNFLIDKGSDFNVHYSSIDIYGYDGTLFFQKTPLPILHSVIPRMAEILPKVVGVMMILTVCGVGLVALVIGLNLFGKLQKIFLRK